MSNPAASGEEPPHDILAAEEFGVPAPDPALHRNQAHDVLAAEEFGLGSADPNLHRGPVVLPRDPTGIAEAHDVLAAEEFAMPAAPPGSGVPLRTGWSLPGPAVTLVALAGLWSVVRRLRRR
jgi:hypothetical protein